MKYFNISINGAEMYMGKEEYYITADCGHEVYEGEYIFTNQDRRTLCPECLESVVMGLSPIEKAAMRDYEWSVVKSGCF